MSTGLGFYLKGELYSNNSIVNITNIGTGEDALHCITDRESCCRSHDGGESGEWYQPGQMAVSENGRVSREDFSRNRGPSSVLLNRRNGATSPTGLYRCEVLDSGGVSQSVYIGLYGDSEGDSEGEFLDVMNDTGTTHFISGIPILSSESPSYSHETRTLTCISSGGPVTSITWMKGGVPISASKLIFLRSQRVMNTVASTYHNLLSINSNALSDYSGTYSCRVSNSRGNSMMSTTISCKFIDS